MVREQERRAKDDSKAWELSWKDGVASAWDGEGHGWTPPMLQGTVQELSFSSSCLRCLLDDQTEIPSRELQT